jgi:Sulfatase
VARDQSVQATRGSVLARAWWLHPWWLHPLLLSAFPVLFLFAANIREQVTLEPLLGPLVIIIAGAATLLLLVVVLFRLLHLEPSRAALVTSIGLVLFFAYGHVWQAVRGTIGSQALPLAAWAALGIVAIVIALRARSERVQLMTGVLNFGALILVVVNLVPIIDLGLQNGSVAVGGQAADGMPAPSRADPDIWYLVFDRYGGQPGLDGAYGFDNRSFLSGLEQRGFTTFDAATANYLKTAHSLASTLEMGYLDGAEYQDAATAPDDWTPLYRILQGSHAVERFLHARGYEYLHLGVRRGSTYANSAADRTFLYGDQTEFSSVLLETTLLVALEGLAESDVLGGMAELYRNHSLYQLDVLEQLASAGSDRPRFIFAHFLLPHPPYVFNADGSWVTTAQAADRTPDQQYLEQVQFTNDRILELLDAIQRSGDEPPVIILQSDEGPFPPRYARDEFGFQWRDATDAELVQKFSILAAYHVPGVAPADLGLTPTMTPINTFRAVFNALFDARLELLPDRNVIFVDQRHLYDFVDVTTRVQDAMTAR